MTVTRKSIVTKSFENLANLKHLVTTLTDKHGIHEEINRKLSSGNKMYK
jgi:hypothetical protein